MDKKYMKGELLQIHTKGSEIVQGRFYSKDKENSSISLYNVIDKKEGIKYENVLHYYNTEVREIIKLKEPDDHCHLKVPQKEIEEIIKVSKKYIFINQVDAAFHEAIEDLNQFSFIAVSADGSTMGRKSKMPFIVMSTPKQIYIFDIQVMQFHAFDAGLKKLLESEYPKKIVHDCRKLSDCLYHKHGVKLESVFDTMVGDLIITKNKKGALSTIVKSLSECLNCYLGLPFNTVEEKLDFVKCSERPLATNIKENLAKNIAYLHCLSEIINEEIMLPFVRGVECFLKNLRMSDDYKAWELSGNLTKVPQDFKSAIEY